MTTNILPKSLQPQFDGPADSAGFYAPRPLLALVLAVTDYLRKEPRVTKDPDDYSTMHYSDRVVQVLEGEWELTPEELARYVAISADLSIFDDFLNGGYERYDNSQYDAKPLDFWISPENLVPADLVMGFVAQNRRNIERSYLRSIAKDEFLGEIKGKLNGLKLRLFRMRELETVDRWGSPQTLPIYEFISENGYSLSWLSSRFLDLKRDQEYIMVGGSVKKHSPSWSGFPATTNLTRVKLIDADTLEPIQ